jgi:adenylylsulfate kinase-like enzyme
MIPILWLSGPPGVGTTAVAWEIYRRLQRDDADPAYVDVDQLGIGARRQHLRRLVCRHERTVD